MASYLTGADDGAFSAAPTVATGFMGKPVLDIRLVKPEGLAKLTRSQMRDIMYSLGKDKPSWTREILREQMAAIVRALMTPQTFGDLSQLKAFEDELGITLPKPGFPWQPRSVPYHARSKTRATGDPKSPTKKTPSTAKKTVKPPKMPNPNAAKAPKKTCTSCGQGYKSKCFYQCCKACCVELKNPCSVHVLTGEDKKSLAIFAKRKGYGVCPVIQPEPSPTSFPPATDVALEKGLKPKFYNAKENLNAFHSERRDVLNWRRSVMNQTIQAEEEAAMDALDRYERNARLLSTIMKVESMEELVAQRNVKGKDVNDLSKGLNERAENLLAKVDAMIDSSKSCVLETRSKTQLPLRKLLRQIDQFKTREEVCKSIEEIGGLRGTSLETIEKLGEWFGGRLESRFEILDKAKAPKPDFDLGYVRLNSF